MLVETVLFLAALFAIVYIVLLFNGKPPSHQGDKALYDLPVKEETTVLPVSDCPWDGRPGSIRFAVFIEAAPKTVSKVDCVVTSTPLTQFGPSCVDSTYKTCKCLATDCNQCTITSNTYLTKIVSIGDVFELWASGYTSTNDKPHVPAILKIRTAQDTTQNFMESISLPAIPLQRWTVVTIVKEGRRYDVYYGEKLVVSKLLDYLHVVPSSGVDWKISPMPGWKGKIGLFTGFLKAQSKEDVHNDVSALVNTRGIPFYLDQINFNFDLTMPECVFGNCNKLPTVKPLNPFAVYASSVQ